MFESILIYVVGPIFTIITTVVAWVLARRKNRSEYEGLDLQNIASVTTMYQNILENLEAHIKTKDKALEEMQVKMAEIIAQNTIITEQNIAIKAQNSSLLEEIKAIKDEYLELEKKYHLLKS
jgi:predicted nuclease with TOPRIM domain